MDAPKSLNRWAVRFEGQFATELHFRTAERADAVVDAFFALSEKRTHVDQTLAFRFIDDWGYTIVSTLAIHPVIHCVNPARQEEKFYPYNDDLVEYRASLRSTSAAGFGGKPKV